MDTYGTERHPVAENLLRGTDEAYTNLLKAGLRMLDGSVVRPPAKETVRLRQVLRGTHWILLFFSGLEGGQPAELAAHAEKIAAGYPVQHYVVAGGFPRRLVCEATHEKTC